MNIVYLSIGSNLDDRLKNINQSLEKIQSSIGVIEIKSKIYENPPIGFESDDVFYNLCVKISTNLSLLEVLSSTQEIERQIGRKSKSSIEGYSSRLIDIDIIFFNSLIEDNKLITIPHKLFRERMFVLLPLSQLAPNFIDPITKFSVLELKNQCEDLSLLTEVICF
jgi:2-amino-4-hydroxy-6-hydroxymethyldihydropteridine diphosphokinase